MDQFIVTIEKRGEPNKTLYTCIASLAQVEDLEVAAEYAGLVVIARRPAAVGTVLQWMTLHKNTQESEG